jgi:hypothetical protein
MGLKPAICETEDDAIKKSQKLDGKTYPVYFFESNTSGEKPYEEFYTENENPDLKSFESLGIITPEKKNLNETLNSIKALKEVFEKGKLNKSTIVAEIKKLLPDFSHIETGKGLDQRM